MSFGIVRLAKIKMGGVQGIEIHDKRKLESQTNPDIDSSKSENNYDIKNGDGEIHFHKFIKNRIQELDLKRAVRKDAIVMGQILVTSDEKFFQNLSPEKQKEFFIDSFMFLENKYGFENIISATVHMDERTPHMHVNFVPVTEDGRLSMKDLYNKKELTKLHDEYYEQVGKEHGLERGEKGGNKKHLETADYKELQEELLRAHQELSSVRDDNELVKRQTIDFRGNLAALQTEKNELVEEIENLREKRLILDGRIKTITGLEKIKNSVEETLLGNKIKIDKDDWDSVYKTAYRYSGDRNQLEKLEKENKGLKSELLKIESKLEIATRNNQLSMSQRIEEKKNIIKLENIAKAFYKLPQEIQEELLENNRAQNRSKDFDFEL